MGHVDELLTRGVANIIPGFDELKKVLESGKKLNIYLGIDPTSTKIHLGHAVSLRKLQGFAELGHHVTFLIGDFTALVGDTSDKDSERPVLTEDEIHENFQTYKKQAEKIVDFSKITVRRNSEWLKDLSFAEIIKLTRHFSVNDFISRELIRKRLDEKKRVRLDEVLYPLMQGYDSYHLDTDLQIGATDQTFNMQAGRTLQHQLREKESYILTTEFLMGTDGRKMSKSWGNAIWLDDTPENMYAKILSINDDSIIPYYTLATKVPSDEIQIVEDALKNNHHPMAAKKKLAHQIVSELYSTDDAERAQENFEKLVQREEIPTDIPEAQVSEAAKTIVDVLIETGLTESKSDARRLIAQDGVQMNGEKVSDPNTPFTGDETLIQVGKRRFLKVKK